MNGNSSQIVLIIGVILTGISIMLGIFGNVIEIIMFVCGIGLMVIATNMKD